MEPIATTYYVLMDAGNILLFNPGDTVLKNEVAAAADRLLHWMDKNGQWQVAYDQATQAPMFREVEDLRPTFTDCSLHISYSKNRVTWQPPVKERIGLCGMR